MGGQYDVAVVGAGHNGLAAAFYLARAGLSVVVVEQREEVGGLCVTKELFPGVRGNYVVNTPNNFEPKVVRDMQLTRHGLKWANPLQPNSMMLFPGARRIVSWPTAEREGAEYDRFAPGEYARYRTMLDDLEALGRRLDVSFFEPPPAFADVAALPETRRERELFGQVMFGTAEHLVSWYLRSEEARTSLGILATTGNFVGPATPGSALQLMMRAMYRGGTVVRNRPKIKATADFSPRAPLGGMGAITQAMANSARARGAEIRLGCGVAEILVDDSAVAGVRLRTGEAIHARVVVSNANPKTTLATLVSEGSMDPECRASYESLEMNGVIGKVHLLLDGTPRLDCATSAEENALLLRCGFRAAPSLGAMQLAFETARQGSWKGDPVIYGLLQTAFDDTLAPAGSHVMSLSVLYAPYLLSKGSWATQGKLWAQHVIRALRQYIGNLETVLVDYGYLSPLDLEEQFGLLGGHPLHGDAILSNMFDLRPVAGFSDYRTPIRGLYLCSNGTWPGNYLSGLCGHNAANVVLEDLRSQASA